MIRIKLKDPFGKWHEFIGDTKSSILEQAEALGIDCPFACRAGACTVCACRVKKGEDSLVQNAFGEKLVEIEDDQFLSCIGGLHEGHVSSDEEYEIEVEFEG